MTLVYLIKFILRGLGTYSGEIENLLKKYPDPGEGADGILDFNESQIRKMVLPKYDVVSHLRVPIKLDRVAHHHP